MLFLIDCNDCTARTKRIIFNLSKDMRSSDVLIQPVVISSFVLLKLMHKAFYYELPQVLSDSAGYSLWGSDYLTVPC